MFLYASLVIQTRIHHGVSETHSNTKNNEQRPAIEGPTKWIITAYYCDSFHSLQPQFSLAYNNRGNAYSAKGVHDAAIADYTNAMKFNPKSADAFYNRGIALQAKKDLDGAYADYSHAMH